MEAIFAPAIGLMNRLRYPIKFGLIFFIVLIPLVGLSINLIATINKSVMALEHERAGLDYIKTLRQPMEHIQQHRGMMAAYLNGTTEFRDRIMQKRVVVDDEMAESQKKDRELRVELRTGETINSLMQQWKRIKDDAFSMSSAASIQAHNSLIADMLALMNRIADSAKITLDPNLDSAYIGNALISALPKMLENMGQARAISSGVAAQGRFVDPKVYIKLSVLSNDIDMYFKDLSSGLDTAYKNNTLISRTLTKSTLENSQAVNEMQALLRNKLLNVETISISADQVFGIATQAITKSYKLYDALVPVFDQVLTERINAGRATMITTLVVVVIVLVLVAYLFCGFYFSLRQSIALIRTAAEKLASGDLSTQVEILSRDEMNQIGTAINKISAGVGQTVSTLLSTSDQFVSVANRLAGSSQSTGNAVACQSIEIEETAHAIGQMAHAVQDVASNTAQAAVSAQQANDASVNGQQVVSVAVDSINKLAGDLTRVTATIHKLEEQSQGISGILDVICGIADQTNLLALNAAIEAARAGEQGRGFAVVADEVRSLAQRTQNSTLEIQKVIEQLQANAQEAVSVMVDSATQINTSVEHASSAGNVLQELTGLVAGISDMNARIATSAEQQSTMANEISNNINNMNSASEQSATIAQSSVEDSAQAMALASEAHSILKRFHVEPSMLNQSTKHKHMLFHWDNSFSVGIAEVDRQHKILIQLVNELYGEMKNNSDTELLARVLQGLIAYTASHFGYEEGLMERHGYEGLAAHKAKHKKLVAQVIAFQHRVEANDESVMQELLTFLKDWLANHIKGSDKKYAAVLTAKGVL